METIGRHRQNLNDFLEEAELQQYSELFRDVLKISKVSQLKFVVTDDLDQIGLSRPEQRRYKKIFSKYFPNPYIYKLRKLLSSHKKHETIPQAQASIPTEYQPFNENNVNIPTKHIINIEDITINKELGKGQFGVVQQGTWTTGNQRLQVAIKCLGQERMTANSAEFLKEAAVMHSIEHPNIVRLYGVVLHSDSLMLVTELAPLRSLLECLREVPLRLDFPVPTLCEFAEQICHGMVYLENKRLIHRDLAARNILVFSKDRVKISDFGLSRALGAGKDYYQTNYNVDLKLPVAWCAPECILYLRFTSASDVWAFGVCLWEMFTYGFQPWAGSSGQQILEAIDAPHHQRLERPVCCPYPYYAVMLECWDHEPSQRPKFRDLAPKLRSIRPQQVVATTSYTKDKDEHNFLDYNAGEIITVLGKENMTRLPAWYGMLSGGACGMFRPENTKPYVQPEKSVRNVPLLIPHSTRHSSRTIRSSLLRCDVKRHTYTGKRTIQRSMISSPQGDVKHTGHVGVDGAYFGDISFLDPAGCPPRQVVTPYKPSEDLEQVPLINPNSPSHLTGASATSMYPMLANNKQETVDREDVQAAGDKKEIRKGSQRSLSESAVSKSILNKVKNATLGRNNKSETSAVFKTEDVHEYQEITDHDTNAASTPVKTASTADSMQTTSSADFSQTLIDEMENLFRNLETRRREEPTTSTRLESLAKRELVTQKDLEKFIRYNTLSKAEKKRSSPTSTMKPMSAHDEKTLNTAVALANEITSKSMNDLEQAEKPKYPHSPNERLKFHFKLPTYLQHHNNHSQEPEKEKDTTGKQERRNFSEEANSVPDLQSTLTAESKMAYTSLIEEPTPSTSLMSHISKDTTAVMKPSTIPKQSPQRSRMRTHSPQTNMQANKVPVNRDVDFQRYADNPLPLPPRTTKPKLIDKPRHIRKYPLKIIGELKPPVPAELPGIIYQNTSRQQQKVLEQPIQAKDVDVLDGPEPSKFDTNPFTNVPGPSAPGPSTGDLVMPGPSGVNPFTSYPFDEIEDIDFDDLEVALEAESDASEEDAEKNRAMVKDRKNHVSVEDLLEFADQKPCGRQRGVESDEVRIMSKVLKKQCVSVKHCYGGMQALPA